MTEARQWPDLVSVVVPVFNAADTLPEQMAALESQAFDGDWELIIADNGSFDDTVATASLWLSRFSRISIVDASGRPGAGYARNTGARHAKGQLLAFCDADDIVDSGWLQGLAQRALSADIAGGMVSSSSTSLPRIMDFLPHACGCCMAVWREVFEELGGFDPRFLAGQDVEFSWRAQRFGFSIGFAPNAQIWRRARSDLRGVARQHFKYGYWGSLLYREYRNDGVPNTSLLRLMKSAIWLVARLPYLVISKRRRHIWVRKAAYGAGAIKGSWKHRVLYTP